HRTITEQARLIEQTTTDRTESATPALRARPRADRHPLSFAQERMWFLHMLDPESPAYNIRLLARLTGPLDAEALRRAVQRLVARHEALRTTFVSTGGQVFQTPRSDLPTPYELRDLTGLAPDAAARTLRGEVRDGDRRPFRLEEELPLRVTLFRVGAGEHRLHLVLHHIAGDGWSLRLLMRDLAGLYTEECDRPTGPPADGSRPNGSRLNGSLPSGSLPELSVQYIDYAEAVRDPDRQAAIEADLDYWVERLAGHPSLELPTDAPVPAAEHGGSGNAVRDLAPATCRAVRELAERTGTTSFEVLLAALNLLLARLSDQQDLVIGFPVANRPGVELEEVVGLFLNTLVVRTDLSGDPTFGELLRRVSEGVRGAYEHQNAPFELLVERLNPARSLDRPPIFDVMLNYQSGLGERPAMPRVEVDYDDQLFEPRAKFPLVLYVREQDGALRVTLVHRSDLFTTERAQLMLGQLEFVLSQAAASTELPVAGYSLLPPGTSDGALTAPDAGLALPLDEPEQPPVTELIAARAAAAPERVALSQGEDTLSYRELVHRSEAVAGRLAARGFGPGDVVGVTGPRGIGFVVALLGVLRSGATAFPLDPALPPGRRRHLLEIGRPQAFVRAEPDEPAHQPAHQPGDERGDEPGEQRSDGQQDLTGPTLRVEARTGLPAATEAPPGPLPALPTLSADAPAYLFFTSGTTGTPRGVLGRHAGLSHFLRWQSTEFGITADDRCAQLTSASFDVMLRDTFLALVGGGTLVLPEAADLLGGRAVLGWLERERVTVLHAAPTVLQSWLLDAPEGSQLPDLRWTFLAGEPLKATLVEAFRARYPHSGEVVNLYGPTETTMAKFAYRVPRGPLPPVLPVGSPLPQCQGVVMREGRLCGVGEPGEIVIRTPFRTFGYLDDPAATAAAFFRNPHRDDERDLLYRSGDIGRLRPDGLLEIVGRRDHQLKISGVRIQPAEVENAINQHPSVAGSLVVGRKDATDGHGEAQLVAYVVAPDGGPELAELLRTHLAERLPRAMVPGRFVPIERIPTTPNGKPDRAALPEPPPLSAQAAAAGAPEEPHTATERAVRELWATVLGGPPPGLHEDFFELGGTSLKLLRLYALLDERFPQALRVAQLFSRPTVAGQAGLIEPRQPHSDSEVTEHAF
ncbi:amino acid adenylation domain-containing protein, partial [Kitasatospora nipponensis]|uniref:non-ribosomal peptide synthetase n=1 Tax=Kitasatospora nipponensis TaxID=258049 RepID=UPI0031D3EF83